MKLNLSLEGATLRTGKQTLPSGIYNLESTDCEVFETSKGDKALKIVFKVMDGDMKGRPFTETFNIKHKTEQVRKIAFDDLFTTLTHGGHKSPKMLKDTNEAIGLKVRYVIEEVADKWTRDNGEVVDTTNNKIILKTPYEEDVPSTSSEPFHEPAKKQEEVPWAGDDKAEADEIPF